MKRIQFQPAGSKVFGTLRVHQGVLVADEEDLAEPDTVLADAPYGSQRYTPAVATAIRYSEPSVGTLALNRPNLPHGRDEKLALGIDNSHRLSCVLLVTIVLIGHPIPEIQLYLLLSRVYILSTRFRNIPMGKELEEKFKF